MSLWQQATRKVELWFKRKIAYGSCLCPLDSRKLGSAPYPCIVCSDIRRRLRGEKFAKNAIVSGGKKYNKRGKPRVWFLPQKVKGKWQFAPPQVLAATAFCIMRRHKIARVVGRDFNFAPFFLSGDGVLGILISNPHSRKATLQCVHASELSMESRNPKQVVFFQKPPAWLSESYVLSRIRRSSNVLARLLAC